MLLSLKGHQTHKFWNIGAVKELISGEEYELLCSSTISCPKQPLILEACNEGANEGSHKKVQFLIDCILDDLAFNQFYCPKYSIGYTQ